MSNLNEMLNKKDIYSMALMLLYTVKDDPGYSTISELIFILDHKNFLDFIKYFEGQTIKVPTIDELSDAIKVLLLYQYNKVEGISWKESMELAGIPESDSKESKKILRKFSKHLEDNNYKIGGTIL